MGGTDGWMDQGMDGWMDGEAGSVDYMYLDFLTASLELPNFFLHFFFKTC